VKVFIIHHGWFILVLLLGLRGDWRWRVLERDLSNGGGLARRQPLRAEAHPEGPAVEPASRPRFSP
jgi:hypothetical protein